MKKFFHLSVKPPVEALRNVSFEIETGEIFGLIGRNSAGKTTLTKIIATLIQPTSERVTVENFDSVKDEVKVRSLVGLATAEERILRENFSSKLPSFAIENKIETISINFQREAEDGFLGETISFLTDNGARILDIETKKPTLFDVLENYEWNIKFSRLATML